MKLLYFKKVKTIFKPKASLLNCKLLLRKNERGYRLTVKINRF